MMDTREEFVKMMCENRDILLLWNAEAGDFVWVKEEDYWDCNDEKEGCVYVLFECGEEDLCFDSGISCGRSTDYVDTSYTVDLREVPTAIWLPRQDQLQEMVLEHCKQLYPNYDEDGKVTGYNYGILNLLNSFNGFMYDFERAEDSKGRLNSLEQLWLAFLMRVKFEKSWNGKEWVKDD